MSFAKRSSCIIFIPLLTALLSCAARIDGVVMEGGAAELTLKTALEPRTSAFIRSFKVFMGEDADSPVLDGEAINRSMAAAPGIKSVSLKNSGPAALEGRVSVSNVGDFLSSGGAGGSGAANGVASGAKPRFISYTEGKIAGTSSIIVYLDRDLAPGIISMLSPEVEEYLSALMAPAVLGETSTKQEYFDLLAAVYGRALADEIAAAQIKVFLEFPRPLSALQGGKTVGPAANPVTGKQAEFDIPLADLLVLEQPLRYEVYW